MNTELPPGQPTVPQYRFRQQIIGLIWAQTESGIIGQGGTMPWHVPEDLAHFKTMTSGHPVIMGRRTWESFPVKYRPLPGRTNIVITSQTGWASTDDAAGAVVVHSLEEALVEAQFSPGSEEIWIAGGGRVYAEAMEHANVAAITVLNSSVAGDTIAPTLGPEWSFRGGTPLEGWNNSTSGMQYRFTLWAKADSELVADA